ncbi:Endonuclease/exonuclease/phosphatase [Sesbania bispinosa]|nr:Endonuclease/exonuclease/phosphatase [Sesbania bispinosa]
MTHNQISVMEESDKPEELIVELETESLQNKKDIQDILQRGPWYVMGHIGISLEMMNTKNVAKIINRFGEVLGVENPEVEDGLGNGFGFYQPDPTRAKGSTTSTTPDQGHGPADVEPQLRVPQSSVMTKKAAMSKTSLQNQKGKQVVGLGVQSKGERGISSGHVSGTHNAEPSPHNFHSCPFPPPGMGDNFDKPDHNLGYIVEFPDDEDDVSHSTPPLKLQKEEESQLILGWNNSLSLKRYREEDFADATYMFAGWGGGPESTPPQIMSWISWNCRGLVTSSTIRELRELCSKYKMSIVFLSETRVVGDKGDILWNRALQVDISLSNPNFIHAHVQDQVEVLGWDVTFLYGNPQFQQIRYLWARLQALRTHSNTPWMILGDFNEMLHHFEKDGLHPLHQQRSDLFRQYVSNMGLMDLEIKGCRFSWFSNPHNGFITREKLDRILVNWEWRYLLSDALVIAIPSTSSDHTPSLCGPNRS